MKKRNLALPFLLVLWFPFLASGASKELSGDLVVFHAGSLSVPFKMISQEFTKLYPKVKVLREAAGSRSCARKISELNRKADIMASADYTVIDKLLIPKHADWNIRFASNEMAIVFHQDSRGAAEINTDNWYKVLLRNNVAFGRSNPNADPCGYRAVLTMKLAEKYKEKAEVCNDIGSHHDEVEMTTLIAPIVQVCDAISGARPGARREVVESYIKRLKELESLALSYPGVMKTYAIQAGRELRVIVGSEKVTDQDADKLSYDIAKKIQDEMTYPGQVKITVIRETRAVNYAK